MPMYPDTQIPQIPPKYQIPDADVPTQIGTHEVGKMLLLCSFKWRTIAGNVHKT